MTYLSGSFFALVLLLTIAYYVLPLKVRPYVLLLGSIAFYIQCGGWAFFQVLVTSMVAFIFGRLLQSDKFSAATKKILLIISVVIVSLPWLLLKLPLESVITNLFGSKVVVVGISFYTFELISYLADVYKGKIEASHNVLSFVNYSMYFPKVIQGPISRYKELSTQIDEGHSFDEKNFVNGFVEILWGSFLKLVIADKALLLVNPVFDGYYTYGAPYAVLGAVLYSIQLYADFLGCVMILHGVSLFFGIELKMNFNRPYISKSFKEFWQRWHISLSSWLTDYIYIPLGGSRKGNIRRYINLVITFLVSAFWHGVGLTFVIWGLLHAVYRVVETVFINSRLAAANQSIDEAKQKNGRESVLIIALKRLAVFAFATLGWIFFRASNFNEAVKLLAGCFKFSGLSQIMEAGLIRNTIGYKDFAALMLAIMFLLIKELANERGFSFKAKLISMPSVIRILLFVLMIFFIINFGTYGYGYDAADFIYGGF